MEIQPNISIRTATPADAPTLQSIYAPYVENTAITFEYETPTADDFRERIRHTLEQYPFLVAEKDGQICGYAYASPFKTRAAYSWSAETSIYVKDSDHHLGVGSALYKALEACLSRQNVCNLCACIAYPNPASEAFHEKAGYKTVAHFHNSGYKNEQWIDIIWMEKTLSPHTIPPLPFVPFSQLENHPYQTAKEESL